LVLIETPNRNRFVFGNFYKYEGRKKYLKNEWSRWRVGEE
jgi:hypothetical protein